jgi:hypothetical protein
MSEQKRSYRWVVYLPIGFGGLYLTYMMLSNGEVILEKVSNAIPKGPLNVVKEGLPKIGKFFESIGAKLNLGKLDLNGLPTLELPNLKPKTDIDELKKKTEAAAAALKEKSKREAQARREAQKLIDKQLEREKEKVKKAAEKAAKKFEDLGRNFLDRIKKDSHKKGSFDLKKGSDRLVKKGVKTLEDLSKTISGYFR